MRGPGGRRRLRILRGSLGTQFLHPTYDVRLIRWVRGEGVDAETLERRPDGAPADELWLRSPPHHLVAHGQKRLRRRIDRTSIAEFPILGDFAALGGRDYLAFRQPLGARVVLGDLNGIFLSWVTDREAGFGGEEAALLERLTPPVALAWAAVGNAWIARALLETYLGRDAAGRVLAGNIVRGRTETIRAVIWYSDLQGFTRLADTLPAVEVLALLNEYVEPLVDAVTDEGGEVLKFVGDGVLAIFGGREPPDACAAALRAWERASGAAEAISAGRAVRGAAVTRPYLALHDGEVLYGNFGAPARLDFTVLGPAVNEAARLAALSRSLDQPLIVSDASPVPAAPLATGWSPLAASRSAASPGRRCCGRWTRAGRGRPAACVRRCALTVSGGRAAATERSSLCTCTTTSVMHV